MIKSLRPTLTSLPQDTTSFLIVQVPNGMAGVALGCSGSRTRHRPRAPMASSITCYTRACIPYVFF